MGQYCPDCSLPRARLSPRFHCIWGGMEYAIETRMSEQDIMTLIQKFETVSRAICTKWGMPEEWEEFYIEMCCALVRKNACFDGKPNRYIIKACKNEAINELFKGKSICSKPRKNVKIVSIQYVPDLRCTQVDFVKRVHDKLLVEKILNLLTDREKQIAGLIMDGYSEREIAEYLKISQPRVNYLKHKIRRKTIALLNRGL